MKIQTPTQFETFTDGVCDVYAVKDNKLGDKIMTLNFGDQVIGAKRYYSARAASIEITRLIRVPRQLSITGIERVVITGNKYKIEQVQHINDSNPPKTVLSLYKIGVMV